MIYQIPGWNNHFENNKSREIEECCYVAMPNKQHGMGLTRILAQPDGAAIFGIWCLILQAASRQKRPRAGWMTDDGTATGNPWDIEDMALRWRRPVAEIQRAIDVLCSPKVGWIKAYESIPVDCRPSVDEVSTNCRQGADEVPADCPSTTLEQNRTEQNRRGGESVDTPPPPQGKKSDNRARLIQALRRAGLAASDDSAAEWGAALQGRGGCATVEEAISAVSWIGGKIAKGGHPIQYARQAGPLIDEWAQVLAMRRERAKAKEQAGEAVAV